MSLPEPPPELARHGIRLLPGGMIPGSGGAVGEADDEEGAAHGAARLAGPGDTPAERAAEASSVLPRESITIGEPTEHGLGTGESLSEHGYGGLGLGDGGGHGERRGYPLHALSAAQASRSQPPRKATPPNGVTAPSARTPLSASA